jgi:hypothetical protein
VLQAVQAQRLVFAPDYGIDYRIATGRTSVRKHQ